MHYVRTPQRINVAPATAARKANAVLRRVIAARELLESLGYTVEPPTEVHESLAAATMDR